MKKIDEIKKKLEKARRTYMPTANDRKIINRNIRRRKPIAKNPIEQWR